MRKPTDKTPSKQTAKGSGLIHFCRARMFSSLLQILKAGPGVAATTSKVLKRPASKAPPQVDETVTEPKASEPTPSPAEDEQPKVPKKPATAAKAKSAKSKPKTKSKDTEEKVYEPNWYKAGNRWGIKVGKREACSVPGLPSWFLGFRPPVLPG